jgi:hypothetical protein
MRKIKSGLWLFVPVVLALMVTPVLFSAGNSAQTTPSGRKVKTHEIWMTEFGKTGAVTWRDEVRVFDRSGKTLKYTNFTKEGVVRRSYEQQYDKYGNRIVRKEFELEKARNEKSTWSHTQWKYNAHGRKIEEVDYSKEGVVKKRTDITYNSNGLKVGEVTRDHEAKLKKQVSYTYLKEQLEDVRVSLDGTGDTLNIRRNRYEFY